jgi:hypothetical protein
VSDSTSNIERAFADTNRGKGRLQGGTCASLCSFCQTTQTKTDREDRKEALISVGFCW